MNCQYTVTNPWLHYSENAINANDVICFPDGTDYIIDYAMNISNKTFLIGNNVTIHSQSSPSYSYITLTNCTLRACDNNTSLWNSFQVSALVGVEFINCVIENTAVGSRLNC